MILILVNSYTVPDSNPSEKPAEDWFTYRKDQLLPVTVYFVWIFNRLKILFTGIFIDPNLGCRKFVSLLP